MIGTNAAPQTSENAASELEMGHPVFDLSDLEVTEADLMRLFSNVTDFGLFYGLAIDTDEAPTPTLPEKPDLLTTFTGGTEKASIQTVAVASKTVPSSTLSVQAAGQDPRTVDVMNLIDLRNDPQFQNINGAGYTVAVLDTGIALDHPAFASRIVAQQDFTNENDGTAQDSGDHGSNVSSIIASNNPNYLGVAPSANIAALQVLGGPAGTGQTGWFEAALQWVIANHAVHNIVAVNMSLGGPTNTNVELPTAGLADEFAKLRELGIVTIVAAGNNYFSFQAPGTSFISADPNVISAGAVWDETIGRTVTFVDGAKQFTSQPGQIAVFSHRATGERIETVFAPGALIVGAAPGGGTVTQGGTSQAAPQISGLVVLAQEIAEKTLGRRLSPDEFERLLRETGQTITDVETAADNVTNTGANFQLADAHALALAIAALPAATAPQPDGEGSNDDVPGDAASTAAVSLNAPVFGTLETAGDQDWYRVALSADTAYQIALEGTASGSTPLPDPLVVIRDAQGTLVASNDDNPAGGRDALLLFRSETTGTFFVEARAYQSEIGAYRLTVVGPESAEAPRLTDDHKGDITTTSVIAAGSLTRSILEAQGDRDWFRLNVEAGNSYTIKMEGASGEGLLRDPFLTVRDANGQVVSQNNNRDATTLDAQIDFDVTRTGVLFIEASAFGNDQTGLYQLGVGEPIPIVTAEVAGDTTTIASIPAANGAVSGTLEKNGDTDWYRLDLTAGARYDFALQGASSNNGTLGDPLLRVFDAQGVQVAENDDNPAGGRESALSFLPNQSGVYFASAEAYAGQGSGTYRLSVETAANAAATSGELVASDATTRESLFVDTPISGVLDFEGDLDWFRADLAADTTYSIVLGGLSSGGGELADPLVRLLDDTGVEITSNDDGGTGFDAKLLYTPAADSTFFVSAEAFAGLSSGSYTLSLEVDENSTVTADTIAADTSSDAQMQVGETFIGTIEYNGDQDWVRTNLVAGEAYEVAVQGVSFGGGTLTDPLLTIYDLNGNRVAFDDDGAGGLDPSIVFSPSYTGTYFVGVSSFESSGPGTYTVSISGNALLLADDSIVGNPATELFMDRGFEVFDTIDYSADEDWFFLDLFAGDQIIFTLDQSDINGAPLTAPRLIVYDDLGQPLTAVDGDQLIFIPEQDGFYFVAATSADESTGDYRLGMAYSEDEGFLAKMELGEPFLGALDFEGDIDWISVDLNAGTYEFLGNGDQNDQLQIGFGALADPILALYDDRGRLLEWDADGGLNGEAGFVATILEDDTYFLEIGSASFASEVGYELFVV